MKGHKLDSVAIRPSTRLARVKPVVHGGSFSCAAREAGWNPDDVLDFSTNCSPFGPSPAALEAAHGTRLDLYPNSGHPDLLRTIAETYSLPQENILVTAGTTETLSLIGQAYLDRGDRVVVLTPTYGDYVRVSQVAGAHITLWRAEEKHGFAHDVMANRLWLSELRPRVLFLCAPNNPTGILLSSPSVDALVKTLPNTLIVIDEAYMPFLSGDGQWSTLCSDAQNVVRCRSLTKDYALAGLRVGYVVASPEIIAAFRTVQPPWSVSTPAVAAAQAALLDRAHLVRSMAALKEARDYLWSGLRSLDLPPLPSDTHYCIVHVGDGAQWQASLLKEGCFVRDCASFGLPSYVRISPRSCADCDRLLNALANTRQQLGAPRTERA